MLHRHPQNLDPLLVTNDGFQLSSIYRTRTLCRLRFKIEMCNRHGIVTENK
uniref:Uncharacterized protein n=1 Tax=Arundo donax TaxID=35708 RepID=A0A0A9G9W3_ARUDO